MENGDSIGARCRRPRGRRWRRRSVRRALRRLGGTGPRAFERRAPRVDQLAGAGGYRGCSRAGRQRRAPRRGHAACGPRALAAERRRSADGGSACPHSRPRGTGRRVRSGARARRRPQQAAGRPRRWRGHGGSRRACPRGAGRLPPTDPGRRRRARARSSSLGRALRRRAHGSATDRRARDGARDRWRVCLVGTHHESRGLSRGGPDRGVRRRSRARRPRVRPVPSDDARRLDAPPLGGVAR